MQPAAKANRGHVGQYVFALDYRVPLMPALASGGDREPRDVLQRHAERRQFEPFGELAVQVYRDGHRLQSSRAPARRTTSPQRACSFAMYAANGSDSISEISRPSPRIRSALSLCCTMRVISVESLAMMSCGNPAGPAKPIHELISKPLTPASSIVGICGTCGSRVSVVTPSARSLPALIWGIAAAATKTITGTWPPITSEYAWAAVL